MGVANYHSWSFTRSKMLTECPRRAFFEYYARDEPESNCAWKLKELQTLPMMKGHVVDWIIAKTLTAYKSTGEVKTDLASAGRRWYRRSLAESEKIVELMRTRARTLKERDASGFKPLHDQFHRLDLGAEFRQQCEDDVARCLNQFEQSAIWEKLKEVGPSNWGPITKLEAMSPSFQFEGITVYASFDLWIKDAGAVVILDWKSGSAGEMASASAEKQLSVYALYALTLMKQKRPVKTQAIWLTKSGTYRPHDVVESAIEEVKHQIRGEAQAELDLLRVIEFKNGRKQYIADRDQYPAKPSTRRCCECKYHTICREGFQATTHIRHP